jgi:hypothetical protein
MPDKSELTADEIAAAKAIADRLRSDFVAKAEAFKASALPADLLADLTSHGGGPNALTEAVTAMLASRVAPENLMATHTDIVRAVVNNMRTVAAAHRATLQRPVDGSHILLRQRAAGDKHPVDPK